MILWVLPLIKNFKMKYFVFFLSIAISDPIGFFMLFNLDIGPNYWYLICSFIAIYSLGRTKSKIKELAVFIVALILVLFSFPTNILGILFSTIIIIYILFDLIVEVKSKSNLNLFVFVLVFYNLTIVLNSLFISTISQNSKDYYLYSVAAMYLFAIFFTFTNEKSKFLQVNINKYLARLNDN